MCGEGGLSHQPNAPEYLSYIRGKQYELEKLRVGRPASGEKLPHCEGITETADRVAAEHNVGRATVERDATFADAVDKIDTDVQPAGRK